MSAISLPKVFAEASAEGINRMYKQAVGENGSLFGRIVSEADINEALASGDRMDAFIRLLSLLESRGFEVPLSTVHWVLAMNRQVELGKKIDVPVEAEIRNMLITRRLGGRLESYNLIHLFKERIIKDLRVSVPR